LRQSSVPGGHARSSQISSLQVLIWRQYVLKLEDGTRSGAAVSAIWCAGSCIVFMFVFVVLASTSARIEFSIVLDGDLQQVCSGEHYPIPSPASNNTVFLEKLSEPRLRNLLLAMCRQAGSG
jgi:hypothetical protein